MKRVPALRDLSDDHHTALIVAQRCKRASAANHLAIWAEVRAGSSRHFLPHFALEEEYLLPALEGLSQGDIAERIRSDHAALLRALDDERPSLAEVNLFGALLERHVRFEEREVFEPFQHELPEAALEALAEASRNTPRHFDPTRLNALA